MLLLPAPAPSSSIDDALDADELDAKLKAEQLPIFLQFETEGKPAARSPQQSHAFYGTDPGTLQSEK